MPGKPPCALIFSASAAPRSAISSMICKPLKNSALRLYAPACHRFSARQPRGDRAGRCCGELQPVAALYLRSVYLFHRHTVAAQSLGQTVWKSGRSVAWVAHILPERSNAAGKDRCVMNFRICLTLTPKSPLPAAWEKGRGMRGKRCITCLSGRSLPLHRAAHQPAHDSSAEAAETAGYTEHRDDQPAWRRAPINRAVVAAANARSRIAA